MAGIGATNPTLLDHAKRLDPNGSIPAIVEALSKRSPLISLMNFQEGNLPTGHRTPIRTGLPTVYWRRVNKGTPGSKSETEQVDESCGMCTGWSNIDKEVANLNGNSAAFRASEDDAFLAAMTIEMERALIYESTKTNPEKLHGLAPRYAATTYGNGANLILDEADDTGNDYTSVYFMVLGPQTCFGIFPKGSRAGFQSTSFGLRPVPDADGNEFPAWSTFFEWKAGLVLRDWRYVVRIGNIDTGSLSATGTNLGTSFVKAYHRLQDLRSGQAIIICNRTVGTFLDLQAMNKSNLALGKDEWGGMEIKTFRGIPIFETDAITDAEDGLA